MTHMTIFSRLPSVPFQSHSHIKLANVSFIFSCRKFSALWDWLTKVHDGQAWWLYQMGHSHDESFCRNRITKERLIPWIETKIHQNGLTTSMVFFSTNLQICMISIKDTPQPSLYLYLVNLWSQDIHVWDAGLYLVFKSQKVIVLFKKFCQGNS